MPDFSSDSVIAGPTAGSNTAAETTLLDKQPMPTTITRGGGDGRTQAATARPAAGLAINPLSGLVCTGFLDCISVLSRAWCVVAFAMIDAPNTSLYHVNSSRQAHRCARTVLAEVSCSTVLRSALRSAASECAPPAGVPLRVRDSVRVSVSARVGLRATRRESIPVVAWVDAFLGPSLTMMLPRVCRPSRMRELVHMQAGQCGNQIGAKFWEVRAQHGERCAHTKSFVDAQHVSCARR